MTSQSPPARPVLWLEPRAAHAWRGRAPGYRCQPLAYLEIPSNPVAASLLDSTGWLHLKEESNALLLGEKAIALAQTIPGADDPRFPLEQGDLRGAPDAAWSTCVAILEDLLGVAPNPKSELLCLVPSLCESSSTLWLRALPEALLGDLYPALQIESVVAPLFESDPHPGLAWAWVIGDRGVSIGARYCGRTRETHVNRGCRSVLDKTAATTGLSVQQVREDRDHSPVRKTQEIFLRDLLQKIIAKSIPLFQEAWSGSIKPTVRVSVAGPAVISEPIHGALERAFQEYGLDGDVTYQSIPYCDLLDRASHSVEPELSAPIPQARPQAVRPRSLA